MSGSVYKFDFLAKGKRCAVELHHFEGCWQIVVEDQVLKTVKHKKLNPFSGASEVMAFTKVFQAYPDAALKGEVSATWSTSSYKWLYSCTVEDQQVPLSWSNHKGLLSSSYPVIIAADEAIVPVIEPQQAATLVAAQSAIDEMKARLRQHEDRSLNMERQLSFAARENDLLSKKVFAMESQMHTLANHATSQPTLPTLLGNLATSSSDTTCVPKSFLAAASGATDYVEHGDASAKNMPAMRPKSTLMADKGVARAPTRPSQVPAAFVSDSDNSWIGAATRALEGLLDMIPQELDMVPAASLRQPGSSTEIDLDALGSHEPLFEI
jgi:hypothetical protein